MRSRVPLFALLIVACSLALPLSAQAGGIPFFGPIIDKAWMQCPLGWGALITVINNIISLLITLAIVFVAPMMIAWAGFLMVFSPTKVGDVSKAKSILLNTVIGIVIALAGWMIVDAIMAVLYNANASNERGGVLGTWSSLIGSGGLSPCIDLKGSVAPTVAPPPTVVVPSVPGRFTFDRGIDAQVPTESAALANLLSCMVTKVPAGVGRISSISDSLITNGQKSFPQCASGGCQHSANSCHYGGKTCVGSSYAVDFGDEQNTTALSAAARACGANYVGNEGSHLHVSVGSACGCN